MQKEATLKGGLIGILSAIMAVCAFGGGAYGLLTGAPAVPREWLAGSPFTSFFLPSAFLFFVVGGSAALAAYLLFSKSRYGRNAALLAGLIQIAWIAVQVLIIGFVSWLQPTVALWGVITLVLALSLPRDWS